MTAARGALYQALLNLEAEGPFRAASAVVVSGDFAPSALDGDERSVGHGVSEHDPSLAEAESCADPGDLGAPVCHGTQSANTFGRK